MNPKKSKVLWDFWLNKTLSHQLDDAIYNNDLESAIECFKIAFKEILVERR